MNRKLLQVSIFSLFACTMLFSLGSISAVDASDHVIQITSGEEYLYVREQIDFASAVDNDTTVILIWIPNNAEEIKVTVNNTVLPTSLVQDHIYQSNITTIDYQWSDSYPFEITYLLPIALTQYSKTMLRNTSSLTIRYDEQLISSADFLTKDSSINVSFPSSTDTALFNVYTLTLTILLIILLLVSLIYGIRKKKNGKVRKRIFESEDVLSTEKNLLMDVLKEIEKMHRSGKMADDTYHKLKPYYKQQTVEIMSHLENMESKIKE